MSFFTQTNYDNNKNGGKTFKPYYIIKDGQENIFRIAPPCRSLALLPDPHWAIYKKVHFGYGIPDSQNPDKTRARPFECIHQIDYKTKSVKVQCPECANIQKVKDEMDQLKEDLQVQKHPADYIKNATTPQFDWLRQHNLDNKWYCYAKNLAGEWNVLKIGHKTKLAVDELLKRLNREDQIKALDPDSGVWIKFTKNGLKGPGALTTVEVLREKSVVNGQRIEVIKEAPLTEADVEAINGLVDVTVSVPKLTYDQINALVESGGDPQVAAGVFSMGQKKEASPEPTVTMSAQAPKTFPNRAPVQAAQPQVTVKPATPKANADLAMTSDDFLRKFANKS